MFLLQVVVASKFDNRLKEFAERWEVDRYLSATGYLHPNAKPFFVALPKVKFRYRLYEFVSMSYDRTVFSSSNYTSDCFFNTNNSPYRTAV